MSLREDQKSVVNDAIVKDLIEAVNSLRYGTIQITIHNARIVQVDKTEKSRFDEVWAEEGGGI